MQPLTIVALGIAAVGFTLLSLFNKIQSKQAWRNKSTEPPGPTLVPWVGRIHDLPIEKMWLKFAEWADTYGPLYRTQMLGDNFIIITDEKIAEDLLVKRAKIYSDRPQIRSLFDAKSTHGSMEYLPLMGKNAHWARQRKFAHSTLVDAGNARYNGAMYHETKRWLNRLLDEPDDFSWSLEDMCSKVMTQLSWDDPDMSEYCTKSAWGLLTQMSPAGPITNVLSPLWHLPFSINPWKIRERSRHDEQQAWWMERLLKTRKLMEIGEARPSFMQKYLDGERTGNLTGDYEASSAIGMVALVGIFTVAGPLYYFLLAMLYHPEWQRKIQKEIDEQCCGRMPELTDTPNLPILRACIKETMRWRPNVPTGVAHEVEADDFYNGYFIPKGTRILPLDYAFQRNATKYPDPESYRPERWLEAGWPTFQEPLTEFPTIMGMTSFGYGQRACLGQGVTRDETIVACGGLLWGFNLVHKQGKNGQPIKPDLNASNSLLIVKPDPYELAFEPRSEARRQEMRANWAQSDAQDKKERADFLAAARAARAPKIEVPVDVSDKPLVDTTIETPVVLPPVVAVS